MSTKLTKIAFAAIVAAAVAGCDGTIYRPGSIDGIDTLSLGARQRLVLVNNKGGLNQNRRVVCTEPSPDVMAAISAQFSASGALNTGNTEAQAAIAGAIREAVGTIGTRTQAIQLIRDGYYRACEAMMNGMIDSEEYRVILNNVASAMITLVGVDAIAGTKQAPALAISPGTAQTTTRVNDVENNQNAAEANQQATGTVIQIETIQPPASTAEMQAKYITDMVKTYLTLNDDLRTKTAERNKQIMRRRGFRRIHDCGSNCDRNLDK